MVILELMKETLFSKYQSVCVCDCIKFYNFIHAVRMSVHWQLF